MVQIRKRVKIQADLPKTGRAGESRRGDPCRIQNPEGGTLAQTLIAESEGGGLNMIQKSGLDEQVPADILMGYDFAK